MRVAWTFVVVFLAGFVAGSAGCGPRRSELAKVQSQLDRVRTELSYERDRRTKQARILRGRVARLEAELAALKRRPTSRPTPPASDDPDAPTRPGPTETRPEPRVSCPAALPDAARKVRRRMRLSKLKRLLAKVVVRRSKAVTLSGSGTRTRQVWTGPCFRITLEGSRVATVELEGVAPRRRRRRRRRRR